MKLSYKNFCLTHPYNENDDARKPMQHYNDWIKSDEGEEDEDDDESFYYMDEGRGIINITNLRFLELVSLFCHYWVNCT